MIPVIAIVGRPNVGKSTLFNRLTRSKDALVADIPGVTRDRQYGEGVFEDRKFIVIDTGGMIEAEDAIQELMNQQVKLAIDEANIVLFLVDAKAGLTPADEEIFGDLRRLNKKVYLVLNKIDGIDPDMAGADFAKLAAQHTLAIAAAMGRGTNTLMETLFAALPVAEKEDSTKEQGIKIAIVGRPNVGKSTLVNRILGEERVIVFDEPGTTRDSIAIPFERRNKKYTLIDTAGIRRRARVTNAVEKFSVIKTLQSIEEAQVVVYLLDAHEGVTDQDLHLIGFIVEAGRALVLAVNKWDGLTDYQKKQVESHLDRKLKFVEFARQHRISALHGTGVGLLFDSINEAYRCAMKTVSTNKLNMLLEKIVSANPPPIAKGRTVKLLYAHFGAHNPPTIIIHGKLVDKLSSTYRRYLANSFQRRLDLVGTPVKIFLRASSEK